MLIGNNTTALKGINNREVTVYITNENSVLTIGIPTHKILVPIEARFVEQRVEGATLKFSTADDVITNIAGVLKEYAASCYNNNDELRGNMQATLTRQSGEGGLGKLIKFLHSISPESKEDFNASTSYKNKKAFPFTKIGELIKNVGVFGVLNAIASSSDEKGNFRKILAAIVEQALITEQKQHATLAMDQLIYVQKNIVATNALELTVRNQVQQLGSPTPSVT